MRREASPEDHSDAADRREALSRREFIAVSAAAGAATLIGGSAHAQRTQILERTPQSAMSSSDCSIRNRMHPAT